MRIADAEDGWEAALIGRNLTNKFYWAGSQSLFLTGNPGGGVNPGLPSDLYAVLNRGREIMLRFTVAFGG